MTITVLLGPIASFATEHPWAAVILVFLIGTVLPAIWSTRRHRRRAAMAVIQALLDTCAAVVTTICRSPRR
jgi:hypothetical protein